MGGQYQEVVHKCEGQVVEESAQDQMQLSRGRRRGLEAREGEGGGEEGLGLELAHDLEIPIFNVCLFNS